MQVSSVNVGSRIVPIFDSRIDYPLTYLTSVSPEIVSAFTIPSSRYYYLSKDGHKIPYLALAAPEQNKRDVKAWQSTQYRFKTVYILDAEDSTIPEVDLLKITEGIKIISPQEGVRRYTAEFKDLLRAYASVTDANERFELPVNNLLIKTMMQYPFNPSANFIKASQLAHNGNIDEMTQYLQTRGVFHFTADDLQYLPEEDIFFYLTRFYGPPVLGNLSSKAVARKYEKRAFNAESVLIATKIPAHIETYRRFQSQFDAYFNAIVEDPNQERIWTGLGATNKERFYISFFDYLALLGRPKTLPPLTLNTIKQLNSNNVDLLADFLKQYRDENIVSLVGEIDVNIRVDFLEQAAERLLQTEIFILKPFEANLCNNRESAVMLDEFNELNYPFLGRGSLANGFDCYTLQELIDTFESNRTADGTIIFRDPLNYEATFSVENLREFAESLRTGRGQIVLPQEVIDLFEKYAEQAELQARSDYQNILKLRKWSKQNSANAELMQHFWTVYFHMGMYMRQWKGPGNPYPVRAEETGEEAQRGTATETEITTNLTQEKIKLNAYMDQMPEEIKDTIRELAVMKRYQGHVEPQGRSIHYLYTQVITRGVYCIRMASGPWAYTGAYYLKQILNKNIPGFDLGTNVEYIQ